MVGCANNHACDYGEAGLMATVAHLDAAGLVHAGSGRNLAQARMPAYLETRHGRVALIAITATFRPWNSASAQRPDLGGRPGINPFGSSTTYTVDDATFDTLKRMSVHLGFEQTRARNRGHFYSEREAPPEHDQELELFGQRIVRGTEFSAASTGNAADIADNLGQIREARRQADWVVVSFHSHDFAPEPAQRPHPHRSANPRISSGLRACGVDAGAGIFAGRSSLFRSVSIYNNKPIFYSLSNLVLQNETVPHFQRKPMRASIGPTRRRFPRCAHRRRPGTRCPCGILRHRRHLRFAGSKLAECDPRSIGFRPTARPARAPGSGRWRNGRADHRAREPPVRALRRRGARPQGHRDCHRASGGSALAAAPR